MNAASRCLRLGFAGTPQFAVAALDALARSRHELVAVFTKPDKAAGRGRSVQSSPVKQRAIDLGIPVQQPVTFRTDETLATLRRLELDALVVVAYGLILPKAALEVPSLGCFNIHASILPRWRGAAPIHRAILAGDALTGITIMRMEEGLDTGPILAVSPTDIGPEDTAGTLHDRLATLGGGLVVSTLNELAAGTVRERAQPDAGVTYAEKINKSEAHIDWREDAPSVLRRVRAFNPWPIAETRLDGAQLRIWEAALADPASVNLSSDDAPGTVLDASGSGVDVVCGRGALRILRLQLAGRKPLTAQEFIKARDLDGARFV